MITAKTATPLIGSDASSGRWSQTPIPSRAFASSMNSLEEMAVPEYQCDVHGIVASRDVDDLDLPDHCPECGGQIWKSTGERDGLSVEAVRTSVLGASGVD